MSRAFRTQVLLPWWYSKFTIREYELLYQQVYLWLWSRPRLTNVWYSWPELQAERLPWHAEFTAVPFFLLPDKRLYTVKSVCVCVYVYTYLTAWRLYVHCRCYQIILRVKHFYTYRERCEVSDGYSSLSRRHGGGWVNTWHWTIRRTVFFSNSKQ